MTANGDAAAGNAGALQKKSPRVAAHAQKDVVLSRVNKRTCSHVYGGNKRGDVPAVPGVNWVFDPNLAGIVIKSGDLQLDQLEIGPLSSVRVLFAFDFKPLALEAVGSDSEGRRDGDTAASGVTRRCERQGKKRDEKQMQSQSHAERQRRSMDGRKKNGIQRRRKLTGFSKVAGRLDGGLTTVGK